MGNILVVSAKQPVFPNVIDLFIYNLKQVAVVSDLGKLSLSATGGKTYNYKT